MEETTATEDSHNVPTITEHSEFDVSRKNLLEKNSSFPALTSANLPLPAHKNTIGKASSFKGITPLAFLGLYTAINVIVYSDRSVFAVGFSFEFCTVVDFEMFCFKASVPSIQNNLKFSLTQIGLLNSERVFKNSLLIFARSVYYWLFIGRSCCCKCSVEISTSSCIRFWNGCLDCFSHTQWTRTKLWHDCYRKVLCRYWRNYILVKCSCKLFETFQNI
jgi:hypothetical protein